MAERYEIGEELDAFVAELVESGRYLSPTEVLQHGLYLLQDQERLNQIKLEWLRAEIQKGDQEEPGIPIEEVFAEIYARIDEIAMQRAKRYEVGEEFDALVVNLLDSGRYSSPTEVLQHGLALLQDSVQLDWLRSEIEKGHEDGPGIPAEEVFAEMRQRIAEIAARKAAAE